MPFITIILRCGLAIRYAVKVSCTLQRDVFVPSGLSEFVVARNHR